jgi:hypothetical protein
MKLIQLTIIGLILMAATVTAHAQREAKTSSAKAAYSVPTWAPKHKAKKKKRSKSQRSRKIKQKNRDVDRVRRNPWDFSK